MKTNILRLLAAVLWCACVCFAESKGPNSHGYSIVDSSLPFVDITSTGTEVLQGTDNTSVWAGLGFSFSLEGASYTNAWISSDGLMGFAAPDDSSVNISMSNNLTPMIAPLWQDWQFMTPGTGGVFYETVGAPGSEAFIVEWSDAESGNFLAPDPVTFEAILYQGSNDILFSYENLNTGDAALSNGAASTEGISTNDSHSYVQWSYDAGQPLIASDSSLLVGPPGLAPVDVGSGQAPNTTPEPASLLLLGSGMLAMAAAARRQAAAKKGKIIS